MNDQNNFSDIPGLGDVEGLDNYLQNQALQAQGITPVTQTQSQSQVTEENPQQQQQAQPEQQQQTAAQPGAQNFTREQLQTVLSRLDEINSKVGQTRQVQQPQVSQNQAVYSDKERAFIIDALNKGYSMEQINAVILKNRNPVYTNPNAQIEQRMAALEQHIRSQEYQAAESAFIDKVSAFGNKWGLSEQDLVTFGNAALSKGINIAMANVDLETVFRAIYPEQYAIRSQRMQPTHTSQIYGGTSVSEGNRRSAAKAEDLYVESFLKSTMPNQYGIKK